MKYINARVGRVLVKGAGLVEGVKLRSHQLRPSRLLQEEVPHQWILMMPATISSTLLNTHYSHIYIRRPRGERGLAPEQVVPVSCGTSPNLSPACQLGPASEGRLCCQTLFPTGFRRTVFQPSPAQPSTAQPVHPSLGVGLAKVLPKAFSYSSPPSPGQASLSLALAKALFCRMQRSRSRPRERSVFGPFLVRLGPPCRCVSLF